MNELDKHLVLRFFPDSSLAANIIQIQPPHVAFNLRFTNQLTDPVPGVSSKLIDIDQ